MSTETSSGTSKGFIISVALNGLLVGLLAAALLWGGPKQPNPGDMPRGGPALESDMARAVSRSAPPEHQEELRQIMRSAWESSQDDRKTVRDAREAIANYISSGDYTQSDLEAEFAKMRAADQRIKESVQNALAKALASLPPESRALLAEELKKHHAARRGERRDRFRDRVRDRFERRGERPN